MAWDEEDIAKRLLEDIQPGWVVNLGIGLPTLVRRFADPEQVMLHSENGIIGLGPPPAPEDVDRDIIDAGKRPATIVPGAAFMDSQVSFAMIRGGHLDLAVLGAYQVAANGDIANWKLPGRRVSAVGGAADLVVGAKRVWVTMKHVAKDGASKLVERCDYPLTGRGAVSRVYTDLAVLGVQDGRFTVIERAPNVSMEQLADVTAVPLGTVT